jgi:hypothetical protein
MTWKAEDFTGKWFDLRGESGETVRRLVDVLEAAGVSCGLVPLDQRCWFVDKVYVVFYRVLPWTSIGPATDHKQFLTQAATPVATLTVELAKYRLFDLRSLSIEEGVVFVRLLVELGFSFVDNINCKSFECVEVEGEQFRYRDYDGHFIHLDPRPYLPSTAPLPVGNEAIPQPKEWCTCRDKYVAMQFTSRIFHEDPNCPKYNPKFKP